MNLNVTGSMPHLSEELPLGVTELLTHIKEVVQQSFSSVTVIGEMSRLTTSAQGHSYFQLIDKESSLSCCIFKSTPHLLSQLKEAKDGQVLQLEGVISFYHQRGQVQLVVKKLDLVSKEGLLRKKFMQLLERLKAENLFAPEKKLVLPTFCYRVAIVTSPQGAALQDLLKVLKEKMPHHDLFIVPALMQGDRAPATIRKALDWILKHHQRGHLIDAVILTRGGGSYEDLWCFNDEELVRYVASYPLCLVSAIGHEIDTTLTDYAASQRAATPTAAGHLVALGQQQLLIQFSELRQRLQWWSAQQLKYVSYVKNSFSNQQLALRIQHRLSVRQQSLQAQGRQLLYFKASVAEWKTRIHHQLQLCSRRLGQRFELMGQQLLSLSRLAEVLSPIAVLKRGYCFITLEEKVLATKAQLSSITAQGQVKVPLTVNFQDGMIDLVVSATNVITEK